MVNLTIINQNGVLLANSREVSEMVGKRHDHLLRDIKGYVKVLDDNPKLGSHNFFIESTYKNSQNKEQPCYLLTRKGCDMVANKMTGEKGILFTATYVTKFEEMEKQLKEASVFKLPQTYKEALLQLVEQVEKNEQLQAENEALSKDILEWADENLINALVRKYGASMGKFSEAWIDWKKELLYKYSININSRITAYLNNSGKKTKPKTLSMLRGKEELTQGLKVAITLCKNNDIDISDILGTHMKEVERLELN